MIRPQSECKIEGAPSPGRPILLSFSSLASDLVSAIPNYIASSLLRVEN